MADAGSKDVIKAFLGEDTEFNGSLTFAGTVRVDGRFEGKISTGDNLIIGEKAHVKAEISVGTLLVQGELTGDVKATKKIHIASNGKLFGNITTPALNIEDGAVMEGGVQMTSKPSGGGQPGGGSASAPAGEPEKSGQKK